MHSYIMLPNSASVLTPITVYDQYSLWEYSGTMTAIIEGNLDSANILWVQVGGDPVTFTSPTNQQTITFTTTDLLNKEFIAYTNKDTLVEQSDKATFYHHPIDTIVTSSSDTGVLINNNALGDIQLEIVPGMEHTWTQLYNSENVDTNPGGTAGFSSSPPDVYTEYKLLNVPSNYFDVMYATVYTEDTPGVWTPGPRALVNDRYIGYDKPIKIVFDYNYYGLADELEVNPANNDEMTGGASDTLILKSVSSGNVSGYVSNVHSIGYIGIEDTLDIDAIDSGHLTGFSSTIHTINGLSYSDTMAASTSETGFISGYTYTLHSNTTVGG